MTKYFLPILFFFINILHAEPLNMTISGDSREKVELESLSPPPDLPNADALPFSLDDGKEAIEAELVPLSVSDAAKLVSPSVFPSAGYPLIPSPPFFVLVPGQATSADATWEFRVVDETNHVWFLQTGSGSPPPQLAWDGMKENEFILNINRTYTTIFVSSSPSNGVRTIPSEANRYLSLIYKEGNDLRIEFSARVYERGEAKFSEEGKFYLRDLERRLYQINTAWSLVLMEPEGHASSLAEERRELWKSYLQKELQRTFIDARFVLKNSESEESSVKITLKNASLSEIESLMHGPAPIASFAMDPMESLIQIREVKKKTIVELRHDRLFRPGSAYLRDEALPILLRSLKSLPRDRQIVLRSYTQKVRDETKKNLEEDPKLSALRSKVLFSLFAENGFLKKTP